MRFPSSSISALRMQSLSRVGSRVTDEIAGEARRSGVDVLPLTAYPTRPLPSPILESLVPELAAKGHPPSAGIIELREAVADEIQSELKWRPDPETEVIVTAGGMHALQLALLAAVEPGEDVAWFAPGYFFDGLVRLCGGIPRPVVCEPARDFCIEADLLEREQRAGALVLNTPCNPTGAIPTVETVRRIAEWAVDRQAVVISDESYDKLVYDGNRHVSFFSSDAGRRCGVLVRSFTKSFGMPQWRVGFLAGPPDLIHAAKKALEWTSLFGPHFNQKLAARVLRSDRGWLDGLAQEFQRNRDELWRGVSAIEGVRSTFPEGNPFLFLRVEGLGAADVQFSRRLIERHGVPNTPGTYHGLPGYVRVPFGGPLETVREAAHRIGIAIREWRE
ncbi:MAG: pyridoxal phosphate-dependent aminotransferase [Verrucomicrobia bacterium]|nr:pyridoxal phosphate-dependent aminotransferase [Verrucomicrobiota bacterium]